MPQLVYAVPRKSTSNASAGEFSRQESNASAGNFSRQESNASTGGDEGAAQEEEEEESIAGGDPRNHKLKAKKRTLTGIFKKKKKDHTKDMVSFENDAFFLAQSQPVFPVNKAELDEEPAYGLHSPVPSGLYPSSAGQMQRTASASVEYFATLRQFLPAQIVVWPIPPQNPMLYCHNSVFPCICRADRPGHSASAAPIAQRCRADRPGHSASVSTLTAARILCAHTLYSCSTPPFMHAPLRIHPPPPYNKLTRTHMHTYTHVHTHMYTHLNAYAYIGTSTS